MKNPLADYVVKKYPHIDISEEGWEGKAAWSLFAELTNARELHREEQRRSADRLRECRENKEGSNG